MAVASPPHHQAVAVLPPPLRRAPRAQRLPTLRRCRRQSRHLQKFALPTVAHSQSRASSHAQKKKASVKELARAPLSLLPPRLTYTPPPPQRENFLGREGALWRISSGNAAHMVAVPSADDAESIAASCSDAVHVPLAASTSPDHASAQPACASPYQGGASGSRPRTATAHAASHAGDATTCASRRNDAVLGVSFHRCCTGHNAKSGSRPVPRPKRKGAPERQRSHPNTWMEQEAAAAPRLGRLLGGPRGLGMMRGPVQARSSPGRRSYGTESGRPAAGAHKSTGVMGVDGAAGHGACSSAVSRVGASARTIPGTAAATTAVTQAP